MRDEVDVELLRKIAERMHEMAGLGAVLTERGIKLIADEIERAIGDDNGPR